MRDADEDKMPDAGVLCGRDGLLEGNEIDRAELGALPRSGMRNANQMNERGARGNTVLVAGGIENITRNGFAAGGELR
jgi:hypothetical protein